MDQKHRQTKCIIVKMGSSLSTTDSLVVNTSFFDTLAAQTKKLHEHDFATIYVVSGAVCCGEGILCSAGVVSSSKQVAAGLGQAYLTTQFHEIFRRHGLPVLQLLLTQRDLQMPHVRQNLISVLKVAMENQLVVIANENDVIELNAFGGNDFLASEIAQLVKAQFFVMLMDVEGVYAKDMQLLHEMSTDNIIEVACLEKKGNRKGIGGIETKLSAARTTAKLGIKTIMTSGKDAHALTRIVLDGCALGTRVVEQQEGSQFDRELDHT